MKALNKANLLAIDEDNLAEIKQLTPLIAKTTKDIRVEEERLKVLITVAEAQAISEEVKDAMIELIWKHAPEAAPIICREAPTALLEGVA